MGPWEIGIYLVFLITMLIGLVACFRSQLPLSQKIAWSIVIILIPIAGCLFYFLLAEETKELFT